MENHRSIFLIHSLHLLSNPHSTGNISIFFAVKKFIDGQYLLMESTFLFRPCVELLFFDGNTATAADATCSISDVSSARHDCNALQCDKDDSREEVSEAKIVTRIYFNRNSILFQVRRSAPSFILWRHVRYFCHIAKIHTITRLYKMCFRLTIAREIGFHILFVVDDPLHWNFFFLCGIEKKKSCFPFTT